jgi:tape measure domain-containing protein
MAKRTETQLVVSAKDLGSKKLKDLAQAFAALRKEQRETANVADRTKVKQAELRATLDSLNKVLAELAGRQSKLDLFKKLGASVSEMQGKLAGAKAALSDFVAKSDEAARGTAAFKTQQKGLEGEVKRSQVALDRVATSYARVGAQVQALGLDSVKAQQDLSRLIGVTSRAAVQAEGALSNLPRQQRLYLDAIQATRAAQEAAAAEAKSRNAAEEAALKRQNELLRQKQVELDRVNRKRSDSAAAFSAGGPVIARASLITEGDTLRGIKNNDALLASQGRLAEGEIRAARIREKARLAELGLLDAQQKRIGGLERMRAALRGTSAEEERYGRATKGSFEAQRTALSLSQRIRGQLLSLTAAYVGIYGVIAQGQRAIKVSNDRIALNTRLLVANANDQKAAAADYQFLREEADRLGFSLTELGTNYSKLAIAGKSAGLTTLQVQEIFSNFSEVSRVNNLGVEEVERVFKALEQILSKGKVQAEELRGQLGDVLPGAYSAFARSLGKSGAELDKLLKDGRVSSSALLGFSREYAQMVSGQLAPATSNLRAELGRLNTSYDDFLQTIANESLAPAVREVATALNEFLKSAEGAQFGKDLATAITGIGQAVIFVAKNLDNIILLTKAWLGIFIAFKAQQFNVAIVKMGQGLLVFARATTAAAGAMGVLRIGLLGVASALGPVGIAMIALSAAYAIYSSRTRDAEARQEALNKQFEDAEKAVNAVAGAANDATQAQDALADSELKLADAKNKTADAAAEYAKKGTEAAKASLAQAKAAEEEARKRRDLMKVQEEAARKAAAVAKEEARQAILRHARLLQEAKDRIAVAAISLKQAEAGLSAAVADTGRPTSESGALRSDRELQKQSQKAAQARKDRDTAVAETKRLTGELNGLLAQFNTPAAVRTPDPAAIIDAEGKGDDAKKAADKAADEAKKAAEQARDEIAQIKKDGLQQQTEDEAAALQAKLDLLQIEYAERYAKIDELSAKLRASGQQQLADELAASKNNLVGQESVAAQRLRDESARAALTKAIAADEKIINNLIEERDRKLEEIERNRTMGRVTDFDAQQQAYATELEYQGKVLAAVQVLRDFIAQAKADGSLSLLDAMDVEELMLRLDEVPAKVEAISPAMTKLAEMQDSLAGGLADTFLALGQGAAGAIQGANSLGDALKGAWDTARNFFADFLQDLALAALKMTLLKQIQSSFGAGSFLGQAASFLTGNHSGGMVGSGAKLHKVDPLAFASARRYHTGGVVGLRADEVPIVAKRGEEVLTENDPRHRGNGGMGGQQIKIINAIDSSSVVTEGLNSPSGTRSVLNVVRANKAAFKAALA